jgi:hypothetical protein
MKIQREKVTRRLSKNAPFSSKANAGSNFALEQGASILGDADFKFLPYLTNIVAYLFMGSIIRHNSAI